MPSPRPDETDKARRRRRMVISIRLILLSCTPFLAFVIRIKKTWPLEILIAASNPSL
jgi:hypothetical protein